MSSESDTKATRFKPPISVEIPTSKTQGEKSKYTEYVIVVKWLKSGEVWTVSRRYSEFAKLHKTMSDIFQGIASLPPKTWGLTNNFQKDFIEKRRKGLEKYMKALILLEGAMNTVSLVEFLLIPEKIKLTQSAVPIEITKIEEPKFGINQFLFDDETGAVFTACEEVKILNKFDAHLSNIRMPWEDQGNIAPVGSFSCWRRSKKGLWELIGTQFYDCPISKIAWSAKNSVVYSALANGDVAGYFVNMGAKKGGNRKALKLHSNVKEVHSGRILCMEWYGIGNKLVTTGTDKRLSVMDASSGSILVELLLKNKITSLVVEEEAKRVIVGAAEGKIGVISIANNACEVLHSLSGHVGPVQALSYYPKRRYLFSGGKDYKLGLWSIKNNRDVLMSERIGFLNKGPPAGINKVIYVHEHKVIFTGHNQGFVAVWSAATGRVTMVFRGHRSSVTDMQWIGEAYILMTSDHNCIRFWQFPSHMELCRAKEAVNEEDEKLTVLNYEDFIKKDDTVESLGGEGGEKQEAEEEEEHNQHTEPALVEDGGGDMFEDVTIHKASDVYTPVSNTEETGVFVSGRDEAEVEDEPKPKPINAFLRPSRTYVLKEEEKKDSKQNNSSNNKADGDMDGATTGHPPAVDADDDDDNADKTTKNNVSKASDNKKTPGNDGPRGGETTAEPTADGNEDNNKNEDLGPKKTAVQEEQEDVDIFAAPKANVDKQKTIEKFADLFGGDDDEGPQDQKAAASNLFGDDDDDVFG
mmetsp:Transcript_21420/g.29998  ORF Transcript_21420/g.29998 Transcript_21420/m.29998 type:complete len:751 (+) Transcript_21420:249-2501(+)